MVLAKALSCHVREYVVEPVVDHRGAEAQVAKLAMAVRALFAGEDVFGRGTAHAFAERLAVLGRGAAFAHADEREARAANPAEIVRRHAELLEVLECLLERRLSEACDDRACKLSLGSR